MSAQTEWTSIGLNLKSSFETHFFREKYDPVISRYEATKAEREQVAVESDSVESADANSSGSSRNWKSCLGL